MGCECDSTKFKRIINAKISDLTNQIEHAWGNIKIDIRRFPCVANYYFNIVV